MSLAPRRFDSAFRWLVPSHTRDGVEHLVELDAYGGNGRCVCEHFQFRLEPQLKRGALKSDATRCHHILAARDVCLDVIMEEALKRRDKEHTDGI